VNFLQKSSAPVGAQPVGEKFETIPRDRPATDPGPEEEELPIEDDPLYQEPRFHMAVRAAIGTGFGTVAAMFKDRVSDTSDPDQWEPILRAIKKSDPSTAAELARAIIEHIDNELRPRGDGRSIEDIREDIRRKRGSVRKNVRDIELLGSRSSGGSSTGGQ